VTTPANDLAPYWSRPWPEAENVGTATLEPHTPVEIVDSYRPEKGSILTKGGGREVMKVKLATTDSPNKIVVTGPTRIKVGGFGPVSDENTAYARYSGSIAVGTIVGVATNATQMSPGQKGWVVVGDIDVGTTSSTQGVCRVMRLPGGGGSGTALLGVLDQDVDLWKVEQVRIIQDTTGLLEIGDTIELAWAVPELYIKCANISYETQRGGSTAGGADIKSQPLVEVRFREHFVMPIVFPAQIEACLAGLPFGE
jgi:hypothetical protein